MNISGFKNKNNTLNTVGALKTISKDVRKCQEKPGINNIIRCAQLSALLDNVHAARKVLCS